ncbi:hypothetical protein [Providencia alcalifaciens]|uniref:hypothetical protein n=1 Tax=Providencia alcalifaciens TaxID=126385 RepID=UPI00029C764C|nr:hypothetical protein [Providencia alcalifaciens]EKT64904.1 hypothetical protein OO9_12350 [Providencia alcalifaciens Dmel2]
MINHRSRWTLQEIRYIESHYGSTKTQDIAKKLGRTATAIRLQAQKLGCNQSKKPLWREDEKAIITVSYTQGEGIATLEKALPHRSRQAIFAMAESMGLRSQRRWRQWEIDLLRAHYYQMGTKIIKQLNNRTQDSVRQKARSLGLVYTGDCQFKRLKD